MPEDWLDERTTQDRIRNVCDRQIRQGIEGHSFTVFSSLDALVADVTIFLKDFRSYLEINTLTDSRFHQVISDFIVKTAIQRKDRVALDWVAMQCKERVTHRFQQGNVSPDPNTQLQVQRMAQEEVDRLVEDAIPKSDFPAYSGEIQEEVDRLVEDAIPPISLEKLIDLGVCRVLARRGGPDDVGRLLALELELLISPYGACIRQAVLRLRPRQIAYLVLAYEPWGIRRSSRSISSSDSFDSNLSFTVIRPLRSFVAEAFVQKILNILQGDSGDRKMLSVLQNTFRDMNNVACGFARLENALQSHSSPIGSVDVYAEELCNEYFSSIGLDSHDYRVMQHLLTLYLAIKTQEYSSVPLICEQLCQAGIPDPRTQLFTPGIQSFARSLDRA